MQGSGKVVNPVSVAATHRFSTPKRKPAPSIHETTNTKRRVLSGTFLSGPPHAVATGNPSQTAREEKPQIVSSPYRGKTAVVVGAGPAGSVVGILLAKRGFNVKVIEKRSKPSSNNNGGTHRSVAILVNPEVTEFLLELGIDVATSPSEEGLTEFGSSCRMLANGRIRKSFIATQKRQFFSERHTIAESILEMGFSQKLPNLEFIFDSDCEEIDVGSKLVKFCTPDGESNGYRYDLLIGADGVNSRVREALQSAGHLKVNQRASQRRYVSIRNLPPPKEAPKELLDEIVVGSIAFGEFKKVWDGPESFFIYQTKNGLVQGNLGGGKGAFESIKGRELEWITQAAPKSFPKDYIEPFAGQLSKVEPSVIGPVTYCSPYIGPNEALIGDACHSATPTLGIGANRAILDARDLDEALMNSQGNLTEALENYDDKCRPQVAAIQELEAVHPQARLEGLNPLWKFFVPLYLSFHFVGNRLLPRIIPQPAFALVFGAAVPPVEALKMFKRDVVIWGVVAGFLGTVVLSSILRLLTA